MEKVVREDYQQKSVIYKFFGDMNINGKAIAFGSGKIKNQQGQNKKL